MLDIIGNFKEMVGMKRLEEKGRRGIMKIEERRGWKRKTNGEEFVRGKFNQKGIRFSSYFQMQVMAKPYFRRAIFDQFVTSYLIQIKMKL